MWSGLIAPQLISFHLYNTQLFERLLQFTHGGGVRVSCHFDVIHKTCPSIFQRLARFLQLVAFGLRFLEVCTELIQTVDLGGSGIVPALHVDEV
jgi:hypothetical protein